MDGEPIDAGRCEVVTLPAARGAFKPLGLDDGEQADLVAFLEALTGEIDPWLGQRPVLPPDL